MTTPSNSLPRVAIAEHRARLIETAGSALLVQRARDEQTGAESALGPDGDLVSSYRPWALRELLADNRQETLGTTATNSPASTLSLNPRLFAGQVALVTGAAAGIGRACVHRLVELGAAVVALDVQAKVTQQFDSEAVLGLVCDVTDEAAVDRALDAAMERFGGLDMLVLNAGILPPSRPIAELTLTDWRRTMAINLDANLLLLRETFPLLRLTPSVCLKGRVVIIGSKSFRAPGNGMVAYSSSKAALVQMARVAAMEWGPSGIRVNVLHPDAVFDTEIWGEDRLAQRALSYNLSAEEYKARNILRTEISSRDVAELTATMLGPAFLKTTGTQVSIDGGNERTL